RAEIEVRSTADTVQLPLGAIARARLRVGYVPRRGLAMALRVPDLRGDVQPVADMEVTVEVDKARVRALIGARDLVVDAVERAVLARKVGLGERVVLHHIAGIGRLPVARVDVVRVPEEIVAVVVRSEERRVGKECSGWGWTDYE